MAFSILVSSACFIAKAQTADNIISNYISFTGGAARWKTVQTIITSGTYTYGGISFPFTTYSKRPDRYKFIVPFNGKYFAQAFNGETGWKIDAFKGETKKTILTGAPARAMLNEADVALEPAFINYNGKGYKAMLDGQDTVANEACFKVKMTQPSGEEETYFFSTADYRLVKKKAMSKNSELEGAVLETTYSDYRNVAGIRLPFKAVSNANGQPVLMIILKNVVLNKPLADKLFQP